MTQITHNKHFLIASRLSKILHEDDEIALFTNYFQILEGNEEDQEAFFNYCKQWKLAPWLYLQIKRLNLLKFLCSKVIMLFEEVYTTVRNENEQRNTEAARFLAKFKERGIDVAVLKGNLFISSVYGDTGYKKMNDFDMLIHPTDWGKVQQVYNDMGYIPLGFGWSGEKGKAAKFSHTGLSFISPNYHCITGTQWGLKSPTSNYSVNAEKLWENTKPFTFQGIEVSQMSVEYNLLHLVLHMGIYKIGIRDCMDVYNLLLSDTNFDEDVFVELCKNSNAIDKAYFTLVLCNFCSGSISESLIQKLEPKKQSFLRKRLLSRMQMANKTGDMQLSYNDYFHGVEMNVFYFSLFPSFHKKAYFYAKIVSIIFFPPKADARKLSDMPAISKLFQTIKARLKAPAYIFALIGEEIGLGITILLFVKMFFETIISLKNYIFRKEDYFQYLKKRGIEPKEIINAVKGIQ